MATRNEHSLSQIKQTIQKFLRQIGWIADKNEYYNDKTAENIIESKRRGTCKTNNGS